MENCWIIGVILLGILLSRNIFNPLFGTAVGTKMISIPMASMLGTLFFTLGAFFNSSDTLSTIDQITFLNSQSQAFLVCLCVACILFVLNKRGIPLSIAQSMIGALLGFNLFYHYPVQLDLMKNILFAWIYAPLLAAIFAFILFLLIRHYVRKHPIGLLYRDVYLRIALLVVGCLVSFGTGSNNVSVLIGPYNKVSDFSHFSLLLIASLSIGIGFWSLKYHKIKIISTVLFPLTPLEAFISALTTAMTLFLFSNTAIYKFFSFLGLPFLTPAPLSVSSLMIGSIVGISLLKGISGLKLNVLGHIIFAWILAPCISCLICLALLSIINFKGF